MSRVKYTEKMFSDGGEEIEKDLMLKASNNQNSDPFKKKGIFGEIWSNQKKRYIAFSITSAFVLTLFIVIIAFAVSKDSKKKIIFPNNDSNSKNNSDKAESDSTESDKIESDKIESDSIDSTESDKTESDKIESDQIESEFIKPDCSEVCDNPYEILVYSDEALKSKLKECGYDEVSTSFKFCFSAIKRHNILRACHNAPPLMFNCKILKISEDYAKYLSENDIFQHSKNKYNGEKLGENLAKYGGDHSGISQGELSTDMWYKDKFYYNFNYPSYQYNAEQFTQVVWKNSTEFGIGLFCRVKKSNECHIVANYYPPGNYGSDEDYALTVQNLQ